MTAASVHVWNVGENYQSSERINPEDRYSRLISAFSACVGSLITLKDVVTHANSLFYLFWANGIYPRTNYTANHKGAESPIIPY
jgi:hypothetical protein